MFLSIFSLNRMANDTNDAGRYMVGMCCHRHDMNDNDRSTTPHVNHHNRVLVVDDDVEADRKPLGDGGDRYIGICESGSHYDGNARFYCGDWSLQLHHQSTRRRLFLRQRQLQHRVFFCVLHQHR